MTQPQTVREQVEQLRADFFACKSIPQEHHVAVHCRIVLLDNARLFAAAEETAAQLAAVSKERDELRSYCRSALDAICQERITDAGEALKLALSRQPEGK
jgi:hypothetical protein